jgi:hypothetical protein
MQDEKHKFEAIDLLIRARAEASGDTVLRGLGERRLH